MDGPQGAFRILVVCTGNICRSPTAERLLADALDGSVEVTSAGTGALSGRGIDPGMASLLERDGHSAAGFAARQLTEEQVRSADLVLALTRDHRAQIVQLAPAAVRRTFTLTEFADILARLDREEGANAQDAAAALRRIVPEATRIRSTARPAHYDVPDPYGGSAEDFTLAYGMIRDAVGAIATGAGR